MSHRTGEHVVVHRVRATAGRRPVPRSAAPPATGMLQRAPGACACACGGDCARCAAPAHALPAVPDTGGEPTRPIDEADRRFAAARLGDPFGDVRLHVGPLAQASAARLGARAWTLGSDVVFGAGEYAPGRSRYRELLLHELVHALQQRGAPRTGAALAPGDGAAEREAARIAQQVATRVPDVPPRVSHAPAAVQRAIRVDPPTMVEEDLAERIATGGRTVGFVLLKLNGAYLNRKDDPAPKGARNLPWGGGIAAARAAQAMHNARFSNTGGPPWVAKVEALPTNVLASDVHVPAPPPWQTVATRDDVHRQLGYAECFSSAPCRVVVDGVPDAATVRDETIAHERQHAQDAATAFESVVGTWDTRLQQALDTGETFSGDTPQAVNELIAERLGGMSEDIGAAFVEASDRLGRRLHRRLKEPRARLNDAIVAPDCSEVRVKVEPGA